MTLLERFLRDWRSVLGAVLRDDAVSPRVARALLVGIVVACAAVRLSTIGTPSLDRTAWKEIDYIEIAASYQQHGFRFLYPEVAWPAEEPRFTAMELPLVPYATALLCTVLGVNVYSIRLVTLLAFTLMPIYVFRLVRRDLGPAGGLVAAFVATVLPLFHRFGRLLLSEPAMILASTVALWHFGRWLETGRRRDAWIAAGALGLAVALKLEPLYLLLPIAWLAWRRFGREAARYRPAAALVAVALLLPLAWFVHAYRLGQASMDVFGVLRGHDKFQTLAMITQSQWWETMSVRVGWHILGGRLGVVLALAGLLAAAVLRRGSLMIVYLLAVAASFIIVAEGNIDAPYRQLPVVPPVSFFVALGALALVAGAVAGARLAGAGLRAVGGRPLVVAAAAASLVILLAARRAEEVRGPDPAKPIHQDEWLLAEQIRRTAGPDSRLVALREYTVHKGGNDLSPVLYHYSGLRGWTLTSADASLRRVEELISRGATHLAVAAMSPDVDVAPLVEELRRRYPVLYEDEERRLLLLDLRRSGS